MGDTKGEREVSKLAAAYTDAVNRMDWKSMTAVYADNGILVLGDAAPIVGLAAIEQAFRRLVGFDREFIFQMTHSGVVEVDGDHAWGRWWFSEIKKPTGMPYELILGHYEDTAERFDCGWRFTRRIAKRRFLSELPEGRTAHDELVSFMPIGSSMPV